MQSSSFKWRSFISFSLFFSFLIMGFSGLILYVAPPGRVYRWTDWHFLLLDLSQWQALHTLFSYLFLIFGIIHLFTFNWKVFYTYINSKFKKGINRKLELVSSFVLVLVFVIGTLLQWQPFKFVMTIGDKASNYWGNTIDYPPVLHAEEMTIDEIAELLLGISGEEFVDRISDAGFQVESKTQKLQEVCNMNGVVPYELFRKATKGMNVKTIPLEQ